MSSYPNQPGPPQPHYYQPPPTNGLGVAGFVVSLSGMIVCLGLTCPIGLVLSLIALTKNPRGFAVAGSIIGLLGSILGVLSVLVVSGAIGAGIFGMNYYGQSVTSYTMDNASWEIDEHFTDNQDTLPAEADGDALIAGYLDEWNNALKYLPTPNSTQDYTITSLGPDGVANTNDDIVQYYTAQTQTDIAMDGAYWDIDTYHTNNGRLPAAQQGTSLINAYRDSWGNALQYTIDPNNQDFNLISAGPDGQFGNDDDITQEHTGFGPFSLGHNFNTSPEQLQEQEIAAAFDLAAKQIIDAFPPGATLPTQAEVNEKVGTFVDAWLMPMQYSPTDNPPLYHLKSAGPDKQWGTSDDLTRSFYFAPAGETDGPL